MRQLRHIAAWALLAAIAAGGVVGPAVHQVQHAVEQAAATTEVCHSEAVHAADGLFWTEGSSSLDASGCDLCTRLLVVPPALSPVAGPSLTWTTHVAAPSETTPVQTITDRFIRGPPSLLGDRLA